MLFVGLYRLFPDVRGALAIVKPDTVIRWHRAGFRAYWRLGKPQAGCAVLLKCRGTSALLNGHVRESDPCVMSAMRFRREPGGDGRRRAVLERFTPSGRREARRVAA